MRRLIDSFKLAYVAFFENMGWNYSVRLSTGTQMSRSSTKLSDSLFYQHPKPWQLRKKRRYASLLETDQADFDEEANPNYGVQD